MIPLLAFLLAPAAAQDCPVGYVCLADDIYSQLYDKVQELKAIEEGQPTFEWDGPLIILTDEKGRVFSNSTGEDVDYLLQGSLTWGHVSADLAMSIELDVRKKDPPPYGFRLRPKLLSSYLILRTDLTDVMKAVDFGLDLDFLYWRKWNLSGYVGARSVGVDVGFDVFSNSGVAVGAHWAWPSGTEFFPFTPAVGWYFAF